MSDKTTTVDLAVSRIKSGMTVGIGGWGSRRKPMAMIRAIGRAGLRDLTVVSYGGPDVGLLLAAGCLRRVVTGFVSLDSIPLEPHFRQARQAGTVELTEWDEGMIYMGLYAATQRLPFIPMRAGLASDVMRVNPELRTVASPYDDAEELLAVPALRLDVAIVHMNRADMRGNGQYLGPDPYFDDLFLGAADQRIMTCEKVIPTAELLSAAPVQSLRIPRLLVDDVVETPRGAHFTSCVPDYRRDEAFQKLYADSARDPRAWQSFNARFLDVDEQGYQTAVDAFQSEQRGQTAQKGAS